MIWRKRVTENPPSLRQTLDQHLRRQHSARACVRRKAASFKPASVQLRFVRDQQLIDASMAAMGQESYWHRILRLTIRLTRNQFSKAAKHED
jgi:hypothetical protein